jgi:hypothetical protein
MTASEDLGGRLSYMGFPLEQGYYVVCERVCQIFVGLDSSEQPPPSRYIHCSLLLPPSFVALCTS